MALNAHFVISGDKALTAIEPAGNALAFAVQDYMGIKVATPGKFFVSL